MRFWKRSSVALRLFTKGLLENRLIPYDRFEIADASVSSRETNEHGPGGVADVVPVGIAPTHTKVRPFFRPIPLDLTLNRLKISHLAGG